MISRRTSIVAGAATLARPALGATARPGVGSHAIRIGQTMPYSGPASAYGTVGRAEAAVFAMINDKGGVRGRRVELVSADDAYNPAQTVAETRRLVEAEDVAFLYQGLGTATQAAVQRYLNARGIPQLYVSSGAARWADPARFPWTIGWQPNYRREAAIYARHLLQTQPSARLGVLYQNDDFGRDYLAGLRDGLGERTEAVVVETASYETSDPTIASQIGMLREAGADALLTVATPKFAAQAIRTVAALGWGLRAHYLSNVSASAGSVMVPAGAAAGAGILSGAYLKDPTDPSWTDDAEMVAFRGWAARWAPELDPTSFSTVFGYANALCLVALLERCGERLSREDVIREAAGLRDVSVPLLLPGIAVETEPSEYQPIKQLQLMRWTGTAWALLPRDG